MQDTDSDSLEAHIRKLYGDLSAADRKMADVVLRHSRDLLGYSATELADLAGVSKASAARFFRRLGFLDFHAFRAHLRSRGARQSPLQRMRAAGSKRTPLEQLAEHIGHDVADLSDLVEGLADADLDKAVNLLANARRVHVAGYRNGYATAFYAAALLSQIRPDVHLLNEAAGRQAELLAGCGSKDVLLAVDFRRRARLLRPIVEVAARTGMPVLALTDVRLSALAAQAEAVLPCPHRETALFDSYVTAVSLVNYLATAVTARIRAPARARMTQIENLHDALGDLEDGPSAGHP